MTIDEIAQGFRTLAKATNTWDDHNYILRRGSKVLENYIKCRTNKCDACCEKEAKEALKEAGCKCE